MTFTFNSVKQAHTIQGVFEAIPYHTITMSGVPADANGTVSYRKDGGSSQQHGTTDQSFIVKQTYSGVENPTSAMCETLILSAIPSTGYELDHWNITINGTTTTSTASNLTITYTHLGGSTYNADATISVVFRRSVYVLEIAEAWSSGQINGFYQRGSLVIQYGNPSVPSTWTTVNINPANVTDTSATGVEGHLFRTPNGVVSGTYNICIEIDHNRQVIVKWTANDVDAQLVDGWDYGTDAELTPPEYGTIFNMTSQNLAIMLLYTSVARIDYSVNNSAYGTISPSGDISSTSSDHIYASYNGTVVFTATPASGYRFVKWVVDSVDKTDGSSITDT